MKFSWTGNFGDLEIFFPSTSEVFHLFEFIPYNTINRDCIEKNAEEEKISYEFLYPVSAVGSGMKALGIAKETFLRVNEGGIMCVQHQLELGQGNGNPGKTKIASGTTLVIFSLLNESFLLSVLCFILYRKIIVLCKCKRE